MATLLCCLNHALPTLQLVSGIVSSCVVRSASVWLSKEASSVTASPDSVIEPIEDLFTRTGFGVNTQNVKLSMAMGSKVPFAQEMRTYREIPLRFFFWSTRLPSNAEEYTGWPRPGSRLRMLTPAEIRKAEGKISRVQELRFLDYENQLGYGPLIWRVATKEQTAEYRRAVAAVKKTRQEDAVQLVSAGVDPALLRCSERRMEGTNALVEPLVFHTEHEFMACAACGAIRNPHPSLPIEVQCRHHPKCRWSKASPTESQNAFEVFGCSPSRPHSPKCPFNPSNFAIAGGGAVLATGVPPSRCKETPVLPEIIFMDSKCSEVGSASMRYRDPDGESLLSDEFGYIQHAPGCDSCGSMRHSPGCWNSLFSPQSELDRIYNDPKLIPASSSCSAPLHVLSLQTQCSACRDRRGSNDPGHCGIPGKCKWVHPIEKAAPQPKRKSARTHSATRTSGL